MSITLNALTQILTLQLNAVNTLVNNYLTMIAVIC